MPGFSPKSLKRLETCHPKLRALMKRVVETIDISIIEGYRGEAMQNKYLELEVSNLPYPESAHNKIPSRAVDIVPYPTGYESAHMMAFVAGFVMATAKEMDIEICWGGDWDGNYTLDDEKFRDYWHFELKD